MLLKKNSFINKQELIVTCLKTLTKHLTFNGVLIAVFNDYKRLIEIKISFSITMSTIDKFICKEVDGFSFSMKKLSWVSLFLNNFNV